MTTERETDKWVKYWESLESDFVGIPKHEKVNMGLLFYQRQPVIAQEESTVREDLANETEPTPRSGSK